MSRWFRHYAGMMSDPKFGGVARFCKRSRAEVLFVWGSLLESASEYDSAVYSWDADAMAELLGVETEQAQAIHDGLVAVGLLADGKVSDWARYAPKWGRLPQAAWAQLCAAVFRAQPRVCAYCGDRDGPFEVDHVLALSQGGSNDIKNLVIACRTCNRSKRDRLLSEWRP